mgnify:FL=1
MNSFKLKEERASIVENMEAIINLAASEDRDITEEEQKEWDGFNTEIESIDKKITIAERQEELNKSIAANVSATKPTKQVKELRDYSFQDAMKQSVSGNLTGLVKEMDQEARMMHPNQLFRGVAIPSSVLEHRAAVTTAASAGTDVQSFTDQLEANLVLASAGANFYSGVNDQKFPIVSGITSSWTTEDSGADVAATGSTSSLTLTPKKLISVVDMSAEAMTQNAGLEAAIRRNMAASIAATLEAALLKGDADVTNAPASIFLDATNQTVAGATPTAAEILNMEATLIDNNVNLLGARMGWILDGGALAEVKALAQVSSVSPIWDNADRTLAGYFAFVTSNCGAYTAGTGTNYLLGDFSKVHIVQFGGIDLLWDPYTKSRQGVGSLVCTSLVDGDAVDNAEAFVRIANA